MANPSTLRRLLASTSVPAELVADLLGAGRTAWLMGVSDEDVAAEAVLCHPPLRPGEVRAVANPTGHPGVHRLTVVALDRPGLLAGTAAVLAADGLSVIDATTTVLPASGLALQRMAVAGPEEAAWDRVGARLRHVLGTEGAIASVEVPRWRPAPPVTVETQPQGEGSVVLTVHAPDRPGLLHATAAWLTAAGCGIDTCHASTDGATATDVLVVRGSPDPAALAAHLGGEPAAPGHGGWYPVRLSVEATVAVATLPWRTTRAVWGLVRGRR